MNNFRLVQRKLESFWNLEATSRELLCQSLLLLPLVALSLRHAGVKRTQTALLWLIPASAWSDKKQSDKEQSDKKQTAKRQAMAARTATTARMVSIAATYYQPWANCLKKSLVLWSLLRQQGIYSEVKIGVRRDEGKFEAHAWVEYEGKVLNDLRDVGDRFAVFERSLTEAIVSHHN